MVGSIKSLRNTINKYNQIWLFFQFGALKQTCTWDDNWRVFPAWRWPSSPQPPAAERQPHHGSLDSNGAEGYVSEPPGWCQWAAPEEHPSLPPASLTQPRWETQSPSHSWLIKIYVTVLWHLTSLTSLASGIIGGILKQRIFLTPQTHTVFKCGSTIVKWHKWLKRNIEV